MTSMKMYICGCVRNTASYIDAVFLNIEKICSELDDYHIIISYDESEDNSLEILQKYKVKYQNKMSLLIGNEQLSEIRTQNISNARNKILQNIQSLNYEDFNYFIMMDMDDVCTDPINIEVLKYIFQKEKTTPLEWDTLSFNRIKYYDIWALSIEPYTFSCWHYQNGTKIATYMRNFIQNKLREVAFQHKNDGLLSCFSAFNGFAIYRKDKFLNVRYEWNVQKLLSICSKSFINSMSSHLMQQPIPRMDDCEHRYFHIRASQLNQARICISPMFLFNN